ncbi:MAG: glycosyltransferase [Bacteroidales bacterium]
MKEDIHFSIIVPVYNRPDELGELLESLAQQTDKNFEILIMEGDSTIPCSEVCQKYAKLHHIHKPEASRSERRNLGMQMATGSYFLFFDSDCILPPTYIKIVRAYLTTEYLDCYGGPDSADHNFSNIQKAINYSMTSMMTTGGIRGATNQTEKFTPRSFNMGLSKEVFEQVGGFKEMIGEDIDLSLRIKERGFKIKLIKEASLFHKRKINLKKFYNQVYTFGKARVLLSKLHPGSLKMAHLFPTCFVIGNLLLILLSILCRNLIFLLPLALYIMAIFIESWIKNKKIGIAFLSVITSYIQLCGYGMGFLDELITRRASKVAQEDLYTQS